MSYGILNPSTVASGYGVYTYSYPENAPESQRKTVTAHIYKTNPITQSIAPAIYATKENLADMSPTFTNMVVAKTNGTYLEPNDDSCSFYGLYYADRVLSKNGHVNLNMDNSADLSIINYGLEEHTDEAPQSGWYKQTPELGIKMDGTVNIHWPSIQGGNQRKTVSWMLDEYPIIIAGHHCLVHHGEPVFEDTAVYSWEGLRIADWNNIESPYNHHNTDIGSGNDKWKRRRTIIGHVPSNNSFERYFYLIVIEGDNDYGTINNDGLDLRGCSHLMADLGCDYAMEMDSGSPSQMRVSGTQVMAPLAPYKIGSALCVYEFLSQFDVNMDGKITLMDINTIRENMGLNISGRNSSLIQKRCDISGDGVVDAVDLTLGMTMYSLMRSNTNS
jgi:hypothetical protein